MVRRDKPQPPSKTYLCPLCNKIRMVRSHDYEVSDGTRELKTPRDGTVSIPQDICSFCEVKIVKKYFQPKKSDVKKVLQSMEDQEPVDEDTSLEDLV